MGMDLRGVGGIERFGVTSWRMLLTLAHEYGWEPAGTEPPEIEVTPRGR